MSKPVFTPAQSVTGIEDHIRRSLFWVNKKTLHGFCVAYNEQEYQISDQCFDEDFQVEFYDRTAEIFKDMLSLQILNDTVFDEHMLGMLGFVETGMTTCGCGDYVEDAKEWYAANMADVSLIRGFWDFSLTMIKGYFEHWGEVTLWTIMTGLTTMTFNFYYLGYALGKLENVFLKQIIS